MKIEPFESQEAQEKRMTTAEEDIADIETQVDTVEEKITELENSNNMLASGLKNISKTGVLGNAMWWRIATIPSTCNLIVLISTNAIKPDRNGADFTVFMH